MPVTATPEPPYAIVARPGPGLATITDTRGGTTGLWSRTLRRSQGATAMYARRACANCGGGLRGGFYKPPQRKPANLDRLCLTCVEGAPPASSNGAT
jgi:hypothetical protein